MQRAVLAALAFLLVGPIRVRAEGGAGGGTGGPGGMPAVERATPSTGQATQPQPPGRLEGDIVEAGPFDEDTTVRGKIGEKLTGVWLLVATAEPAAGKFKNFPQLLKITAGKSGPQFHLLDVRLPDSVERSVHESSRTLAPWVPSEEERKLLGASWAKLPPAKEKTREEPLYGQIHYLIAATPDDLGSRSQPVDSVLKGSKFVILITEDYKPRPPRPNGSQVARRSTYYGVKTVEKNELKGDMYTAFVAMGAGSPFPLAFPGHFAMYRLASP